MVFNLGYLWEYVAGRFFFLEKIHKPLKLLNNLVYNLGYLWGYLAGRFFFLENIHKALQSNSVSHAVEFVQICFFIRWNITFRILFVDLCSRLNKVYVISWICRYRKRFGDILSSYGKNAVYSTNHTIYLKRSEVDFMRFNTENKGNIEFFEYSEKEYILVFW